VACPGDVLDLAAKRLAVACWDCCLRGWIRRVYEKKSKSREGEGLKKRTCLLSGPLRFRVIDVEFALDWLDIIVEEVGVGRGCWAGSLAGALWEFRGELGFTLLFVNIFLIEILKGVEDSVVHLLEHMSDRCGAIRLHVTKILRQAKLGADLLPHIVGFELGLGSGKKPVQQERDVLRVHRHTASRGPRA